MLAKEELEGIAEGRSEGDGEQQVEKEARSLIDVPVTSIWKA
jgi:hypothetical protein